MRPQIRGADTSKPDWPTKEWTWRVGPSPLMAIPPVFVMHRPRRNAYWVLIGASMSRGPGRDDVARSGPEVQALITERLAKEWQTSFNEAMKVAAMFPADAVPDYGPRREPVLPSATPYRNPAEPPVMLAELWEETCPIDPTGYWMSEKLDGIRAYWDGKQLISRLGNVFAAPEWFTECFPDVPLDGELFMGRGMFNETSSIVKKQRPHRGWRYLVYFVFDLPKSKATYESRQATLEKIVEKADCQYLRRVPSLPAQGSWHVRAALKNVEEVKGEGLMLVKPGSKYQPKRTHCLLKVKSFKDAEGVVVGYEPGKGRHKGRMGALWVEREGKRFKVGGGFTDEQRNRAAELYPMGTVITYRYFELTPKGLPRFPRFLRVRSEEPVRRKRSKNRAALRRML